MASLISEIDFAIKLKPAPTNILAAATGIIAIPNTPSAAAPRSSNGAIRPINETAPANAIKLPALSPSDTIAGPSVSSASDKTHAPTANIPTAAPRNIAALAPRKSKGESAPTPANATCNAIIFAIDSHSKVFNAPTNVANASDIIFIATAAGTSATPNVAIAAAPMSRTLAPIPVAIILPRANAAPTSAVNAPMPIINPPQSTSENN